MRAITDGAILPLIDEGLGQRGNLGNGNFTYLILRLMREHCVGFSVRLGHLMDSILTYYFLSQAHSLVAFAALYPSPLQRGVKFIKVRLSATTPTSLEY